MIKNEREYRITRAHLAGFEGGLVANDERELPANVDPGMKQVMQDAIASQIETFRHEIDHYEKLRDGHITSREITSLHELPIALIAARIAYREIAVQDQPRPTGSRSRGRLGASLYGVRASLVWRPSRWLSRAERTAGLASRSPPSCLLRH
jgi:hypothetical protein